MKKIIFKSMMAPGDILMLQLAVRELHKCYPDQFQTDIVSPYPEITYGNPLLTKLIVNGMKDEYAEIIDIGYDFEFKQSRFSGRHFSDSYITDMNQQLGLDIRKSNMYPSIYLNVDEMDTKKIKEKYNLPEKFWLINAGIKQDIPLKSWVIDHWIEFIDHCDHIGINLIQVGSHAHIHPEFNGSIKSLVGETEDLREFIKICYAAEGSIGPISMHMHIMAAFCKPCIVIAGGRETSSWEQYPIHQFLHTVGSLKCCRNSGCYKKQRNECENINEQTHYPECMTKITPLQVWRSFKNYV